MRKSVLLGLALIPGLLAAYDLDVKTAEELRVRDGLPNFFAKLERGGAICFVYTISENMVASLSGGKNVNFGSSMEAVANRYGIPTIDLGLEVVRQVKEGTLIFKGEKAPEGQRIFAEDGTHPGDEGHDIYRDVIVRSFDAMRGSGAAGPHSLPEPIDPGSRKETRNAEQKMGRFFFIPEQVPGEHTVRFEVRGLPDNMSYYVGPLLIVGDILPVLK